MKTRRRISLNNEAATKALAKRLAVHCLAGMKIYLQGEIGAGKTTLIRALIQALGVTGAIKSPTYALVESYTIGTTNLHHFDLYRLAEPLELEYIGIRDYFDDKAICFIEWPEKADALLPKPDLLLKLSINDAQGRFCFCEAHSLQGAKLLNVLQGDFKA